MMDEFKGRMINHSYEIEETNRGDDSISFLITHKFDIWIEDENKPCPILTTPPNC